MKPFELPDDLTELSAEDLEAAHAAAQAEAASIHESKSRTAADLERMREIAEGVKAITAEQKARDERGSEMDEVLSTIAPAAEEDPEPEPESNPEPDPTKPETETEPEGDPSPTEPETPSEPAESTAPSAQAVATSTDPAPAAPAAPAGTPTPEAPAAGDSTAPQPTAEATPAPAPAQEPATVAASASNPPAGAPSATAINAHKADGPDPARTEPEEPARRATIVAAANLPDITSGTEMDLAAMADAFNSRVRTFPSNGRPGQMRQSVAVITKPFSDDEVINDPSMTEELFTQAADETKLPGGSLVASGGWCAPSETIYDLVSEEVVDGILSLPTRQVNRGGIRHTLGPDFRTIYDGSGFTFTEAVDESGDYQPSNPNATGKSCVKVPCPDFTDDRLQVAGLCITSGILQNVAYPEMTQRFIDGSLVGHMHRVNSLVIDSLVSGSDSVSPTAVGGRTTSLLANAELVATDMRYRHRMGQNQSLELVLPIWAKAVVRADLSNRLGINMLDVTDAMIDGWFRDRKINPQYVYDWQDDMIDGSGFGAETPITAFPTTVDFLIYRAGTWVKGESDIITVDAIYDSTNLPANNFTALFTEEGWLTAKRRHDSRVVTVAGFDAVFGLTMDGENPAA